MRTLLLTLPLAVFLVAAAEPEDAALEDARCLLALGRLGALEDEAARRAGELGVQYYLGRLDGRGVADLEALLNKAVSTMRPEEMEPAVRRCGAVIQERGQALQAIGERLNESAPAE